MLIFKGHKGRVSDLAFSPNGRLLASCGIDRTVRLWDTQTCEGSFLFQPKNGAEKELFSEFTRVAFTRDGTHLVARSILEGLKAWNLADKRLVATFLWERSAVYTGGLAIAPVGDLMILNQWIPQPFAIVLRRYNTATWKEEAELYRTSENHHMPGLAFDPAGKRLATLDGVFDVRRGKQISKHSFPGDKLQWSPRDPVVAGAGYGNEISITHVKSGKQVQTLTLQLKHVQDFAFSPDGRYLAAVSNEELARSWDTTSWRERDPLAFKIGKLKCIAFASDGQRAACGSENGKMLIWDWDL